MRKLLIANRGEVALRIARAAGGSGGGGLGIRGLKSAVELPEVYPRCQAEAQRVCRSGPRPAAPAGRAQLRHPAAHRRGDAGRPGPRQALGRHLDALGLAWRRGHPCRLPHPDMQSQALHTGFVHEHRAELWPRVHRAEAVPSGAELAVIEVMKLQHALADEEPCVVWLPATVQRPGSAGRRLGRHPRLHGRPSHRRGGAGSPCQAAVRGGCSASRALLRHGAAPTLWPMRHGAGRGQLSLSGGDSAWPCGAFGGMGLEGSVRLGYRQARA